MAKKTKENNMVEEEDRVYFILNPELNIIKIGISFNPFKRLYDLQSNYETNLKLLGFIKGGKSKENELHEQFKEYRLDIGDFEVMETEWFLFKGTLKEYIKTDLMKSRLSGLTLDKIKEDKKNSNRLEVISEEKIKLIKKTVSITEEQYNTIMEEEGVSFSDKLRRYLDRKMKNDILE